MRRAALPVAGVAAIAAVLVIVLSEGGEHEPAAASQSTATAKIQRKDLRETAEADGTLGYTGERSVTGRNQGTITWLPEQGDVVRPGSRLYEVDGEPVFLLDGYRPAWRALGPGTEGADVAQLQRSLHELGYGELEADGTWDDATTDAVLAWQEDEGLTEDATIALGEVVFLPGDRRVAELPAAVGAASAGGQPVLATTSTRRRVTVKLEASRERLAVQGATVKVELPDGRDVRGTIESVGKVAQAVKQSDGSEGDPTIDLTIRLRKAPTELLDHAPVDVELTRQGATDVLVVPVTALLARTGGTYAVEVHDGAARRIVPVDPGVFADGEVEIEGGGLRDGMTVTDARV